MNSNEDFILLLSRNMGVFSTHAQYLSNNTHTLTNDPCFI